jgi:hypothetical protein
MKRNVIVFGLISGLIITAFMVYGTLMCYNNADFDMGMAIGYASMIVAFSFIFVGVKNYRDKYNGGVISFGKAFKTGFYISLVASTMYVVVWLIEYYVFIPDFMEKYTAYVLEKEAAGGSVETSAADMEMYKEWYKNPLFVILLTYSEVLPVGLIISLISALILKRKPSEQKASVS